MPLNLRRLVESLLLLVLAGVLLFGIGRSAVDLWTTECPAYDGITHRGEHTAMGCR